MIPMHPYRQKRFSEQCPGQEQDTRASSTKSNSAATMNYPTSCAYSFYSYLPLQIALLPCGQLPVWSLGSPVCSSDSPPIYQLFERLILLFSNDIFESPIQNVCLQILFLSKFQYIEYHPMIFKLLLSTLLLVSSTASATPLYPTFSQPALTTSFSTPNLASLSQLGAIGSLTSVGSIGSFGTLGSLGNLGSESLGMIGSLPNIPTISSVRTAPVMSITPTVSSPQFMQPVPSIGFSSFSAPSQAPLTQPTAIPSIPSIATTGISASAFSTPLNSIQKLGISTPQLNFSFPTSTLTQAGAVFQAATPNTSTTTATTPAITSTPSYSNSTFGGFSDAYKSQMAYLIASIKDLNTSDGKLLTDKLTMDLISKDNTLNLINMNKSREQELKPLLQYQVKQFLSDIDLVKDHLSQQTTSVVIGDSNLAIGQAATIGGNNNAVIGNNNMVVGSNNALVGNQSIISGYSNGMIGNNGVTVGLNNSVNASNSYVFTSNNVVTNDNTLVVGNTTIDLTKLNSYGSYVSRG